MKRIVLCGAMALTAAAFTLLGQTAAHVFVGPSGSVRSVVADCQEIDTPSDASLNCAPSAVPNDSDQLTEQEVAEPGFNGNESHGGGSGGSGGGGGHGGH